MNPERRQSARQHIPSLVYVELRPSNGGIVLDLSEGGMQISVANRLTGAEQVRFSFRLPTRERIEGTGCIAWISPSGKNAGVSFVSLPPTAREQIRKHLGTPASTDTTPDATADAASTPAFRRSGEGLAGATLRENAVKSPTPDPPKPASARKVAPPSEHTEAAAPPARTVPAPPPPWLEALIRAGQRELDQNMSPQADPAEEEIGTTSLVPEQAEPEVVDVVGDDELPQDEPPVSPESATALYLPNYRAVEKGRTGDVRLWRFHLRDSWRVAVKLAFERFEEFGWTLESDWHIWVALVLLAAGFLALMQEPPLAMLAGALWIASAMIALKRKEKPRSAAKSEPDRQ